LRYIIAVAKTDQLAEPLMLCGSKRFCEEIGWLMLCVNVVDIDLVIMNVVLLNCMISNIDVLCLSISGWSLGDVKCRLTV